MGETLKGSRASFLRAGSDSAPVATMSRVPGSCKGEVWKNYPEGREPTEVVMKGEREEEGEVAGVGGRCRTLLTLRESLEFILTANGSHCGVLSWDTQ